MTRQDRDDVAEMAFAEHTARETVRATRRKQRRGHKKAKHAKSLRARRCAGKQDAQRRRE